MILFILFIGFWLGINVRKSWIIYLIVTLLVFLFIFWRFKKQLALLFLCTISIGIGVSFIRFDLNLTTYHGVVTQAKTNYYIFSNGLEKLYIKEYDHQYEIGDILTIEGEKVELNIKSLESEFDFGQYLNDQGIYYQFIVKNSKRYLSNPIRLNNYKKRFLNNFDPTTKDFIGSLYFGSGFSNNLTNELKNLHLYRLASLSGLSIYAMINFITFLFAFKYNEETSKKYAYAILIPYFIFSIHKFSVFKICFLYIFSLINKKFLNNKYDYMERLSIFGLGCLAFDYHLAYQMSFNLSFLLTILMRFYNNSFHFLKPRKKKIYSFILIMLFFIPYEVKLYHEISLIGPLIQTLLSPFIILISFFTMLCFYFIPMSWPVNQLTYILERLIYYIKPIFITITCKEFPLWFSLLYELILIFVTHLYAIRFKPLYKMPLIFVSLFGLYFVPIKPYFQTYISFINIGQGDSTLIHIKGLDILVDTGGSLYKDIATTVLIPYFKKQQIYDIDYLITTHDDYDHSGAKDSLMEHFRVKKYLNEVDQFPLKVGDFVMNNLNIYSTDSLEENENSLVFQFSLKGTRILIMGDAPKNIENAILKDHPDLRCDILKVGHHGSNTSSGYNFVKTVDPDTAIISCGVHNKYGHPHKEVLATLNHLNVKIRRTDIESTITYYF